MDVGLESIAHLKSAIFSTYKNESPFPLVTVSRRVPLSEFFFCRIRYRQDKERFLCKKKNNKVAWSFNENLSKQ